MVRKATLASGFGRRRWPRLLAVALLVAGALQTPLHGQPGSMPEKLGGGRLPATLIEGDAIMVFFATWSPRCRDIVERVGAIERSWGSSVPVILVDFQESEQEVRDFLAGRRPPVDVYLDREGAFSKKHAMTTLPGLLVLRGGKVAYRGKLPGDVDAVLAPIFD